MRVIHAICHNNKPINQPESSQVALDIVVGVLCCVLATLTTIVSGLLPHLSSFLDSIFSISRNEKYGLFRQQLNLEQKFFSKKCSK